MRPSVSAERSSASVFSYHANRSAAMAPTGRANGTQPQTAARPTKGVRRIRRAMWAVAACLMGAAVLLNLLVSSRPVLLTVNEPAQGRLFLQSEDVYAQAASQILQRSLLSRTKLTIHPQAVAKELSKQYPELGSVIVSVPLIGQRPKFYLEPATPALLLVAKTGDVYILDSEGKALAPLARAPAVSKLNLPTVVDESGLPITLGSMALPSTNIAFITEVVGQLKAKHISVQAVTLPAGTSELRLRIGGAPYVVRFNLQGDARAEAGAFLAVKGQLDREKKVPKEYIDVRVENRAYYK